MNQVFSADEATKLSSKTISKQSPEFRTFMATLYEAIKKEALKGGKSIIFFTQGFSYRNQAADELIEQGYAVHRTNDSFKIWWD